MHPPLLIAVDGPVAAGKGTLARRLADHYGLAFLDTGALYRAVALRLVREGCTNPTEAESTAHALGLTDSDLSSDDLRGEAVGQMASRIAAFSGVRAALLVFQRQFAAQPPAGRPGAVLDGRDIGTVVCPQASVKLFVTARPEVRARRRYLELAARGLSVTLDEVLADLLERDARDQTRTDAPLKPAPDAQVLDTSDLDAEGAFSAACAFIDKSGLVNRVKSL